MKKVVTVAAASLLLVVGLVALTGFGGFSGWCPSHRHGRDPAAVDAAVTDHVEDTVDDLDATPEQRARILAVKDRLLASVKGLHGARKQTHDALLAEWTSETPDAAKLHALVEARAEELKAFAHEAIDAAVEVHSVLTPEQREKLTRKMERRHR